MKNDEQNLIAEAKKNLETAKQQLDEFGSDENVDQTTKDLLQRNYENAQVNLKVVTKMANVKEKVEEVNKEEARKAVEMAKNAVAASKDPQLTPIRKDRKTDQVILPNQTTGNDITIHFPSSAEIKSAVSYSNAKQKTIIVPGIEDKSADPAVKNTSKKMSTREALREAAKQTFVGGGSKKPIKKENNHSKNESGMTREEYRKRHNK